LVAHKLVPVVVGL